MALARPTPTQTERVMNDEDFIVSKTDPRGIITYGNKIFIEISGYEEPELLGAPHAILRHPDMPRAIFKLLWDTIQSGREINAYVKNLAKDGSFYWVFANVTPSFDARDGVVGYHSVRRKPKAGAIQVVSTLYQSMLDIERRTGNGQDGMKASKALLDRTLQEKGVAYDEFVLGL